MRVCVCASACKKDHALSQPRPALPPPLPLRPTASPSRQPTPVSKEEDATGSPGAGGAASTSGVSVDKPGEDPKKRRYRVVVMGAAKVGKTAIINQFLYDSFTPKYTRTVEEMHHGEYEVGCRRCEIKLYTLFC